MCGQVQHYGVISGSVLRRWCERLMLGRKDDGLGFPSVVVDDLFLLMELLVTRKATTD